MVAITQSDDKSNKEQRFLLLAIQPHLISAATLPNGDLERALHGEPLAQGRDEVLYLACTHPRVLLSAEPIDAVHPMIVASRSGYGSQIRWRDDALWGTVRLPPHARPSAVPWAILDDALRTVEHLPPQPVAAHDPDGPDPCRQELLAWVFDRHLELDRQLEIDRGTVFGARIDMRLEYIGQSASEALRRPAGAHHKIPEILGRLLMYEPHRLMYLLVCEVRVLVTEASQTSEQPRALAEAHEQYDLPRDLIIDTAEQALIAWLGTRHNRTNTGPRIFPSTATGDRLRSIGIDVVAVNLFGLPDRFSVIGRHHRWQRGDSGKFFFLTAR